MKIFPGNHSQVIMLMHQTKPQNRSRINHCFVALIAFLYPGVAIAQDTPSKPQPKPEQVLIGRFEKNKNLEIQLAADSSQISHPIAFSVDDFGRVFVAESFRYIDQRGGWTDIRWRMPWLQTDLASRSITDRKKLYESQLGAELPEWKKASERVRLLQSPDAAGIYQKASVFAEGFNDILDGTMAGLLATRDHVYVTSIPSLWRLDGASKDVNSAKHQLHTGFGVRLGYLGHDLHGLCWGPDGRLYFSLGDRGANVKTSVNGELPDTGGVFRCEADGSNLELFAKGLRNPQELAFDAFGNLWTCDNNADRGDKARWVWVLPGGDSGWRIGYQHLNKPVALGAWTSEKIWYPAHSEQSGLIVPPVANLAQGPSGVAAHPGTGISTEYTGQFLVCDYLGDGGGIYAIDIKRDGSGYAMHPARKFLWQTPANDVDFAPDGSVLFTTWTGGIAPESSGALYRVVNTDLKQDPLAKSTAEILKSDPQKAGPRLLGTWLEHPDMRVRRFAQFELVKRGKPSLEIFQGSLARSFNRDARIASLWGIAQLHRLKQVKLPADLIQIATDSDPEVRATLARVLADSADTIGSETLVKLLDDPDDRVKLWASLGLAKHKQTNAVPKLIALSKSNNDKDVWLRHAVSSALANNANEAELLSFSQNDSSAVRRMAVIALFKKHNAKVVDFLGDPDDLIVADAARAIHGLRDPKASFKLASFSIEQTLDKEWSEFNRDSVVRRWIAANLREGSAESASRLIVLVQNDKFHENLRTEAMEALIQWDHPSEFDSIEGTYFPVDAKQRPMLSVANLMTPEQFGFLSAKQPVSLVNASLDFIQSHLSDRYQDVIKRVVQTPDIQASLRAKALDIAVKGRFSYAADEVHKALQGNETEMKIIAIGSVTSLPESERDAIILTIMKVGTLSERQKAIEMLFELSDQASLKQLEQLVNQYVDGSLDAGLRLDVNLTVHKLAKEGRGLRQKLDDYMKSKSPADQLIKWRDTIAGGDPVKGKAIFENRTELSCVRCHETATDATRVGPSLAKVGERLKPEQILLSIVKPGSELAKGFETVVLGLKDGTTVSGLNQKENETEIVLLTSEGKPVSVAKDQIEERANGGSLMPDGLADKLNLSELRDLIAFLLSSK